MKSTAARLVAGLFIGAVSIATVSCSSSSLPFVSDHYNGPLGSDRTLHDAPSGPAAVEVGTRAVVPNSHWVTSGAHCVVEFGAWIIVREDGWPLVEYKSPDSLKDGATSCDSGEKFYVDPNEFRTMSDRYIEKRDAIRSQPPVEP